MTRRRSTKLRSSTPSLLYLLAMSPLNFLSCCVSSSCVCSLSASFAFLWSSWAWLLSRSLICFRCSRVIIEVSDFVELWKWLLKFVEALFAIEPFFIFNLLYFSGAFTISRIGSYSGRLNISWVGMIVACEIFRAPTLFEDLSPVANMSTLRDFCMNVDSLFLPNSSWLSYCSTLFSHSCVHLSSNSLSLISTVS